MPAYQQGGVATIQNCSCWKCSEGQHAEACPMTEYAVEQQQARVFDDQIVNTCVEAVPVGHTWALQTAMSATSPHDLGFSWAQSPEQPILESWRHLASQYLNNPNAYLLVVPQEPGASATVKERGLSDGQGASDERDANTAGGSGQLNNLRTPPHQSDN
ncbi:hypothetical protein EI94DRAFT_1704832 [Lactarius quietus]|nr:hypothetical protein EI94DRAFT_1704832 [Lactarius quietus]